MKTKFFALVAICVAILATSCNKNKIEESPLDDTGLTLTISHKDGKKAYGINKPDGSVMLPAEYSSIYQFNKELLLVENEQGKRLIDKSGKVFFEKWMNYISEDKDGNISFDNLEEYYIYFKETQKFHGPYLNIRDHASLKFYWMPTKDGCCVFNRKGQLIADGDFVTYLYSRPDKKHYFVVTKGKNVTAYDEDGKEIFPLDAKKLENLPKPSWTDKNSNSVTTINPLEAFKGKAGKKTKR